jgi:peptide chain release factor 3
VCKRRRTPIFTFVNKCDRVGEDPLKLLSDVEADLGIMCHPITWPIFRKDDVTGGFVGVYDRRLDRIYVFEKDVEHGARRAATHESALLSDETHALLGDATYDQLLHDVQLLDEAGHPFDAEAVASGELSPVFFGSALTNFGVEPFLREFLELAPSPLPREATVRGEPDLVDPTSEGFSGFVFKIQSNMDPRHRDRVAFVRVCSGHFEPGIEVTHVRTGKPMRLASAQTFMARERQAVEEAWPGDVIGVMDRGTLRIGDTLAAEGKIEFQGIPRFAPEHFARVVLLDPMKRKQLDAGLRQLTEEGAAQVFFTSPTEVAGPTPIVGAVGQLQFDVMLHRLEHEYGVRCRLEKVSGRFPRWVTGQQEDIERVSRERGRTLVYDAKGHPLFLLDDAWTMRYVVEREEKLKFYEVAP